MSKIIGKNGKEFTGEFVDVQYDWMLVQGKTATELTENVRKQLEKEYETIGNVAITDDMFYQAMEHRQELFIDDETGNEIEVKEVIEP
jgi:hypothetical protein